MLDYHRPWGRTSCFIGGYFTIYDTFQTPNKKSYQGLFHVRLDSPTLDYSTDGSMYDILNYHYSWTVGGVLSDITSGGWYYYNHECGIFAYLDDSLDYNSHSLDGSLHREPYTVCVKLSLGRSSSLKNTSVASGVPKPRSSLTWSIVTTFFSSMTI